MITLLSESQKRHFSCLVDFCFLLHSKKLWFQIRTSKWTIFHNIALKNVILQNSKKKKTKLQKGCLEVKDKKNRQNVSFAIVAITLNISASSFVTQTYSHMDSDESAANNNNYKWKYVSQNNKKCMNKEIRTSRRCKGQSTCEFFVRLSFWLEICAQKCLF